MQILKKIKHYFDLIKNSSIIIRIGRYINEIQRRIYLYQLIQRNKEKNNEIFSENEKRK